MVKSKVTIGAGEAPAHPGHVARKLLGHAMLVVSVATGISAARLKLLAVHAAACLASSPTCPQRVAPCRAAAMPPLQRASLRRPLATALSSSRLELLFALCDVLRFALRRPPICGTSSGSRRLSDEATHRR